MVNPLKWLNVNLPFILGIFNVDFSSLYSNFNRDNLEIYTDLLIEGFFHAHGYCPAPYKNHK